MMITCILKKTGLLFLVFLFSLPGVSQKLNEDSLVLAIQQAPPDTSRVDAILTYVNYLNRLQKNDSLTLSLLKTADSLATAYKYPQGHAQVLLLTGNYNRYKHNWTNSIEAYQDLIRFAGTLAENQKRKSFLRAGYNNLGGIFNINGDYTTSLENRLKSIEVIESMEPVDPNDLAISYINVASDYRHLKEYDKAGEYIRKVSTVFDSIQNRLKLEYYFEYYHILVNADENEKAVQVLNQYDSVLRNIDLSPTQRLDYTALSKRIHGMYEMEHSKNYQQAAIYFYDHLAIAKEMKLPGQIATASYNYGWSLYAMGNYNEAISMLKSAFTLADSMDMKNQAFQSAGLLAKSYQALNNYPEAYKYAQRTLELKDSMSNEEALKQLNFLEAKYQYEKNEKEIATLQQGNQQKEFVIRRKNILIIATIIVAVLLALLAAYVFRYYKNKQRLAVQEKILHEEKIRLMEQQQQVASLQSMINGQETERTRIAKDLHDGLGGVFSTVKMHYSTLEKDTPALVSNPIYRKTMDLINSAADELRRVAHNMMPEVLMKVGLTEALQDFCNNISSGKILRVSFQSYGMENRLGSSTEIMIYRIIQELMNNIIKHADATEAIIQINGQGNRLSLTIEDNGRGFDTREADLKNSMGMSTVKSRVDYLNGKISIDSRKDVGTTVMIDILINEN